MVEGEGYQVLEIGLLDDLAAQPSQHAVMLAVMRWVISRMSIDFPELMSTVALEAIPVRYLGDYPAFGIKYMSDDPSDMGGEIASAIASLIEQRTGADFVRFLADSKTDWWEEWNRLRARL